MGRFIAASRSRIRSIAKTGLGSADRFGRAQWAKRKRDRQPRDVGKDDVKIATCIAV
jgi:hypothetical protein